MDSLEIIIYDWVRSRISVNLKLCHVLTRVLASGQHKPRYTARIAKASFKIVSLRRSFVLTILVIILNTRGTGTRFPAACTSSPTSFRSHMVWSVRSGCSPLIGQDGTTLGCDWLTRAQHPRHMVRATHYITHSSLTKQEHFLMTHRLEDRDNLCLSSSNLQMGSNSTSL